MSHQPSQGNALILEAIEEATTIQTAGSSSLMAIAARALNPDAPLSRDGIAKTLGLVQGCAPDCEESVIEDVRHEVMDLLRLISMHRQAGADLVYQAYEVDIGFAD